MSHSAAIQPTPLHGLLQTLRAAGVLNDQQLVQHGVSIVELSRSHYVALIEIAGQPQWIAKRFRPPSGDQDGTLSRERFAHELASQCPTLSAAMPREITVVNEDMLITEAVNGPPLWDAQSSPNEQQLAAAASTLAAIHAETSPHLDRATPSPAPWILRIMDVDAPEALWNTSRETLQSVAQRPGMVAQLRQLRSQWANSAVIHGDTKLDNVLWSDAGQPVFIDWELCGSGDPAWDLAGLCVNFAHRAAYPEQAAPPEQTPNPIQPDRFWSELAPTLALVGSAYPDTDWEKLVGLTGAWLVQSAVVAATASGDLSSSEPAITAGGYLLVHYEACAQQLKEMQ